MHATPVPSPKTAADKPSGAFSSEMRLLQQCLEDPLLWEADYLATSPGLPAVPLVFWLMDALRPGIVVTACGPFGAVHMAACQAAERLDLATQCYWTPAETGQQQSVAFRNHLERFPARRSAPAPSNTYWHCFEEREEREELRIDLLMINLSRLSPRSEFNLAATCAKMAPHGAVLFYGTGTGADFDLEAPTGWSLLDLGAGEAPLTVVLGPEVPEPLNGLSFSGPATPESGIFNRILVRQGRALEAEHHLRQRDAARIDPAMLAAGRPETLADAEEQISRLQSAFSEDLKLLVRRLQEVEEARIGSGMETGTSLSSSGLIKERDELRTRLQAMRNSTSWRITGPLRSVARRIKAFRRR